MSASYTADGRRKSSMTHARRGHQCTFCSRIAYGNGGHVAHGRWHVRHGHAVELVKCYGTYPPMSTRIFVSAEDVDLIARMIGEGFEQVGLP